MTVTPLVKHHGLGNDFLIALDPDHEVGSPEAKRWCDRRTGIGADGLIVARSQPTTAEPQRWSMVLWNADGSRAEISGNGLRCLGQAIGRFSVENSTLVGHGPETTTTTSTIVVDTDAGERSLTVRPVPGDTWQITAAMGTASPGSVPTADWSAVGLTPDHQQSVDVGNPHVVAIVDVDQFDQVDMAVAGPAIEAGFPGGVNVHVVTVTDRAALALKVWERGVGVTQACGSGACAAAWAANRLGLVGPEITVTMPGGSATVEVTNDHIDLTGPATFVGRIWIA